MSSPQPQPATPSQRPDPGHLEWVRPARQGRSQQTLERLLAAAEGLLAERGFDEIGVAEIAREARSSVGSFYARFPDKEAVLRALQERFNEEAKATADLALDPARWEDVPTAEIVSALIAFLVQISRDRRGLLRAILIGAFADAELEAGHRALSRYVSEGIHELLTPRARAQGTSEPERAVDFALRQAGGVLSVIQLGLGLDYGRFDLSDEEVARETTQAFLAYLGIPDTGARAR